ncbi:MAG: hypothetical protein ACKVOI_11305 [Dongiaceae bacterium]
MAFNSRDLSVLAYANGFTLWHYRTADGAEDLMAEPQPGAATPYFAGADELLREGDQIVVNLQGGNRPVLVNLLVTQVASAGRVSVARL